MKYNITPGELVAEIRMERAAYFSGPIVIVEALDDKKFWQAFFDLRQCRLVMSHGKETALAAYDLLKALEEADKILVLIDDDFDSMLGRRRVAEAIVYTDAHDIEAILLRSNALGRVIWENVDSAIVAKFEQILGRPIRDTLIERTVPLGRVRFCAQRDQWSVSFKKLTCFSLYDSANCSLDENKLLDFVLQQTAGVSDQQ